MRTAVLGLLVGAALVGGAAAARAGDFAKSVANDPGTTFKLGGRDALEARDTPVIETGGRYYGGHYHGGRYYGGGFYARSYYGGHYGHHYAHYGHYHHGYSNFSLAVNFYRPYYYGGYRS